MRKPGLPFSRVPLIRRRGFPKRLICLRCGRGREAQHAGDRMHEACRVADDGVPTGRVHLSEGLVTT